MAHKFRLAALAACLIVPQLTHASEPAAPASAAPADDAAKPICKREPILGSRLPGPKVCKTAEQWKQNDRDAQDATRRAQENRRSMDPGSG